MVYRLIPAAIGLLSFAMASSAQATLTFDDDVTPDIIFGSGNANGAFTVERDAGVELGLRAKLRFDEANQPQNVFNSNGDGTYTFPAGTPPIGFGFDPSSPATTPIWSFEWSVNSNWDGSGGVLRDVSDGVLLSPFYILSIDFDPGPGTNFLKISLLNTFPEVPDHAIGDNSTPNGGGTVAASEADFLSLIDANNVMQNSWNMEFFNGSPPYDSFDPNLPGVYTIVLEAFAGSEGLVSSVSIDVLVTSVPEPATFGLMLLGLAGLGGLLWRRSRGPARQPIGAVRRR